MTDYDVDIREVTPEYNTLLPREAGRETDPEREVKLRRVTVTVKLSWDRNRERYSDTYDLQYRVNHGDETVRAAKITDAFGDLETLGVGALASASAAADQAVGAFLDSVGLAYDVTTVSDQVERAQAESEVVTVYTDLEVDHD